MSGGPGDQLGESVDILGDRAVFGAPAPLEDGYVVTATFTSSTWSVLNPSMPLSSPAAQLDERFGDAVAIAGDLLVVGAPLRYSPGATDAGRVSIFQWTGSGWTHLDDLFQPDASGFDAPEGGAQFGGAVDLWHDPRDPADPLDDVYRLIVGSPAATVSVPGDTFDSGRAFIFASPDGSAGSWTFESSLQPPLAAFPFNDGDRFAASVAIDGDIAVIGAPRQDDGSSADNSGRVYIAERDPSSSLWSIDATQLLWLDNEPGRQLGAAVDASDGTVIIAAPGQEQASGVGGTVRTGSAFLARKISGSWTEIGRIQPLPDPGLEGFRFGEDVSLLGGSPLIAASAAGPGATADPSARLYVQAANGEYVLVASITDPAAIGTALAGGADATGVLSIALGRPANTGSSGRGSIVRGPIPLPTCPHEDCNGNGIPDVCDIGAGVAEDCNENGIPDECEVGDLTLDCNTNGLLDACESTTAEIVWVIDGSASTGGKQDAICGDLIPLLEAQLAAAGLNVSSLVLGVGTDCDAVPCLDAGQAVEGLYGTSVPIPDNGMDYGAVSVLDGCESWAAATAIVAQSHPWRGVLRIVIPIADECAWEGGDVPADCDTLDELSVDAAGLFADCRDVFVMPVQTPDLQGVLSPPVTTQMAGLASLTSGVAFQLPDLSPVTIQTVRDELETAIRTRMLVHDFEPYIPDGTGGATFGNGILDTCEIDDPGAFPDCNGNGINDSLEILLGDPTWMFGDVADTTAVTSSVDLDGNGLLDICEAACCPGDLNRNGFVDFDDLLIVLADYTTSTGGCGGTGDPFTDFCDPASSPAGPCPGDVNGDGDSDFQDLLLVLSSFDSCFVQGGPPCAVIRRGLMPAPQSVLGCLQRAGWDPVKAAACIDALNIVGSQP